MTTQAATVSEPDWHDTNKLVLHYYPTGFWLYWRVGDDWQCDHVHPYVAAAWIAASKACDPSVNSGGAQLYLLTSGGKLPCT